MALDGNFILRSATADDASALAAIELEAFPDPSWSASDFLRYDCTVAVAGEVISGFLVSREIFAGGQTPPEREMLNVAVKPQFRRQGVGQLLVAHELDRRAVVFLEVRRSNVPAIQLYKKMGFTEVAERPDYYSDPAESALVMRSKW